MEEIWPTHARRPDFEFDFEFFLFWFDDFRRVVEWATEFLLFRFNGKRLVFFFFFWFDFRRLDCCSFGLLISGELVPAWMYAGLGEEKRPAWILLCFSFLFLIKILAAWL